MIQNIQTTAAAQFCRTCGADVTGKAICTSCGCQPENGNSYCNHCGSSSLPQAILCVKCGRLFEVKQNAHNPNSLTVDPSKIAIVVMLVGFLLPWLNAGVVFTGVELYKLADLMKVKNGEIGEAINLMYAIPFFGLLILIAEFRVKQKTNIVLLEKLKFLTGLLPISFTMWLLGEFDGEAFKYISVGLLLCLAAGSYFLITSRQAFSKKRAGLSATKMVRLPKVENRKLIFTEKKKRIILFSAIGFTLLLLLSIIVVIVRKQVWPTEPSNELNQEQQTTNRTTTAGMPTAVFDTSSLYSKSISLPDSIYEIQNGRTLGPIWDNMSEQDILSRIPNAYIVNEPNPEKYYLTGDVKAVFVGNEKLFVFKRYWSEDFHAYQLQMATDNPKYHAGNVKVGMTQAEYLHLSTVDELATKYEALNVYLHTVYRSLLYLVFEDRNNKGDFVFYQPENGGQEQYRMLPSNNPVKLLLIGYFQDDAYSPLSNKQKSQMHEYTNTTSDYSTTSTNNSPLAVFSDRQSVANYLLGKTFSSEDGTASISIGNTIKINGTETHFNLSFSVISAKLGVVRGESLYNPDGTITIYVNPQEGYLHNAGERYYLK